MLLKMVSSKSRELLGDKTVDAKEATKKLIAAHKTIHEYQLLENLAQLARKSWQNE